MSEKKLGFESELKSFTCLWGKVTWLSTLDEYYNVRLCEVDHPKDLYIKEHPLSEIYYIRTVLSGSCVIQSKNADASFQEVYLREGDSIIGGPWDAHREIQWKPATLLERPFKSLFLCFHVNDVDGGVASLFNDLVKANIGLKLLVLPDQYLFQSMRSARSNLEVNFPGAGIYLKSLAGAMCAYVCNEISKNVMLEKDLDVQRNISRIKKLLNYIDQNLSGNLSLKKWPILQSLACSIFLGRLRKL